MPYIPDDNDISADDDTELDDETAPHEGTVADKDTVTDDGTVSDEGTETGATEEGYDNTDVILKCWHADCKLQFESKNRSLLLANMMKTVADIIMSR